MTDTKRYEEADVKLSDRLSALAECVPEGARFADIGTDHALLPVHLARSGKVPFAVAGDVHKGPVEAARRQVAAAGLTGKVSVRHGDGLTVLEPGEVDAVCIAGMGGSLMVRLLEAAGARLDAVHTLILSPHVAEDQVRHWLIERSYVLDRERLVEEDGETYTILRAVRAGKEEADRRNAELYDSGLLAPCVPAIARPLLELMGPLLLRGADGAFGRKWEAEIAKREHILGQLRRSTAEEAARKASEWEETIRTLKEVLACWRAERRSSN
ncbi:SAM-dependent methyltransferase [Cohnella xylanilytica]|uniref:SAM-dependent methyltransferase n=1 Tax=Cohnella xylanilytica TaxID=557555 RepID=A0A841U723_9BACL|nr:class I SAM-dependent methyltransferase [Cohnella xylanilytica]MBB6695452.1 SAM-dependent methyltransferase [Cohnella xylanilytica]